MGRRRENTRAVTIRIDINLMKELMSTKRSLCTIDPSTNELKFRHGSLARYITRLIFEDLKKEQDQEKLTLDNII